MGLVSNKVKSQVDIPPWCLTNHNFMKRVARGLIDTDGSVYLLKSGRLQISFTNRSRPLMESFRKILLELGFHPSQISSFKIYLTKKTDLTKYYKVIGFNNTRHKERFEEFCKGHMGGSYSGNYSRL